jgi:hypothetical protein
MRSPSGLGQHLIGLTAAVYDWTMRYSGIVMLLLRNRRPENKKSNQMGKRVLSIAENDRTRFLRRLSERREFFPFNRMKTKSPIWNKSGRWREKNPWKICFQNAVYGSLPISRRLCGRYLKDVEPLKKMIGFMSVYFGPSIRPQQLQGDYMTSARLFQ